MGRCFALVMSSTSAPGVRAIGFLLSAIATAIAASLLSPMHAAAQGVTGYLGSDVQLVEMQPVAPVAGACGGGVPCFEALDEARSIVGTQTLSLTGWGFGIRGLSATVLVRARARLGSAFPWPRADDQFDALLGYAQLVRGRLTVRAGRQEIRSGLGFPSFDGASLSWARPRLRAAAYGGRSLARGLREPVNEALRGIEDFLPDQGVYLFGGSLQTDLPTAAVTARYQGEILADRSGLASERASLDASTAVAGARLLGSLDYDFAFARIGKGRLTLMAPLGSGRWIVEASARRYVPYFSLSTIWGFFEPVSYQEAEVRVGWSPRADLGLSASGGWRWYGDTGATVVLEPLQDEGRRAELDVTWRLAGAWAASMSYRLEWGPGGFLSSGSGAVRWGVSEDLSVSASVMSFQQIEEFRLSDGRALGGGVSVDAGLTERISLTGGLSALRHSDAGEGVASPWSQMRAWSSLRVRLGQDPGLANRGSRR